MKIFKHFAICESHSFLKSTNIRKFQFTQMGVLAPRSAHARPYAFHQHERKFFGAHICKVTFKHLPKPIRSHIRSFGTLGQLLKCSKKTLKKPKNDPQGARGGLQICLGVNVSFFCENKPPVKFQNSN